MGVVADGLRDRAPLQPQPAHKRAADAIRFAVTLNAAKMHKVTARIRLYHGGEIAYKDFMAMNRPEKDIMVELILPKEHAANLFELPEETAGKAMILAKKMAARMKEKLNCDGFNVIQNNGEVAGQTVFHFHMHLIPRYENDGQPIQMKSGEAAAEELDAVKAQILGE